jgi:membrane protein required for colicin V production
MQAYDVIMLIVLAATTFLGFRKGLAWQIASLAAIFFSYFVAMQFRDVVAAYLRTDPPWNRFLAMLILYLVTSLAIWILFQLVRGFIDRAKLKEFDQQLGAIFGLLKGGALCVVITFFAVTLLGEGFRQQVIESRSGLYIARLLDRADTVMPTGIHDFLDPYLLELDERLEAPAHDPAGPMGDEFPDWDQFFESPGGSWYDRDGFDEAPPPTTADPYYAGSGEGAGEAPQRANAPRRPMIDPAYQR